MQSWQMQSNTLERITLLVLYMVGPKPVVTLQEKRLEAILVISASAQYRLEAWKKTNQIPCQKDKRMGYNCDIF